MTPDRWKSITDYYKMAKREGASLHYTMVGDCIEEIERLQGLLKVAKCPNCDGSGCIARQVSSRQYVTRDMAIDAGDESLEGSLYSEDEWEQEQCQWCDEVKALELEAK